jgi:ribosomal protein S6
MRKYRLVLIIKRALDKKAVDNIISEVRKLAGDVKNDKLTELGEKKFAYKIKKEQSGNYVVWEFEAEKVSLDLESKLRLNDNVLRHLLVRLD